MGDVHNGTLAIMVFSLSFCILFPFLAYPISMINVGSTPPTVGQAGNITWEDLGVSGIFIYSQTNTSILNNGVQWNVYLGGNITTQIHYLYWWNGHGGGEPDRFILDCWYDWSWTLGPWGWRRFYSDVSGNIRRYVTNAEVISNWDSTNNYTRVMWTYLSSGTDTARNVYMFIYDNNTTRNDIVTAINIDHNVTITLTRGISQLDPPAITDFFGWYIGMLTFQDTYHLGTISWIFSVILLIMSLIAIVSSIIVLKSLISGWT